MHVTLCKLGKAAIPPTLYGGTERIIYWLGKALVELGHKVTLIANRHSHIPGAELRAIDDDEANPQAWHDLVPVGADLVHLWDTSTPVSPKPFLVTIDGNGKPGERFHPNTVFVSRRHAENHGSRHFVHNGIDPGEYAFSEKREDFAVFLAKARWKVKNLDGAVSVARRAGLELRVLGSRNWPFDLQRVLPAFRGVRYYGMLGGAEKQNLLARARCLIFPVRWEEPFGIALIEALVSGAFVAATPYGSLPEIVTPEVGVMAVDAASLITAVQQPLKFPPQVCRDRVLNGGFTHLNMARKYLACYEQVLTDGRLGKATEPAPATRVGFDAKELLPWRN
jgi:glycosyltransferase involved in cell wall biosynthesis